MPHFPCSKSGPHFALSSPAHVWPAPGLPARATVRCDDAVRASAVGASFGRALTQADGVGPRRVDAAGRVRAACRGRPSGRGESPSR